MALHLRAAFFPTRPEKSQPAGYHMLSAMLNACLFVRVVSLPADTSSVHSRLNDRLPSTLQTPGRSESKFPGITAFPLGDEAANLEPCVYRKTFEESNRDTLLENPWDQNKASTCFHFPNREVKKKKA